MQSSPFPDDTSINQSKLYSPTSINGYDTHPRWICASWKQFGFNMLFGENQLYGLGFVMISSGAGKLLIVSWWELIPLIFRELCS